MMAWVGLLTPVHLSMATVLVAVVLGKCARTPFFNPSVGFISTSQEATPTQKPELFCSQHFINDSKMINVD